MPGLLRTVDPTATPITTAQMESQLRLDQNNEQEFIGDLIAAVTDECEQYLGRQLMPATYRLDLDEFPADGKEIELPFAPLQSVTSVKYRDSDNVQQTLSASVYEVDATRAPGRLRLATGQSWPTIYDRYNAVEITYAAGYSTAAHVPAAIRLAIRELVAHHFTHREPVVTGTIQTHLEHSVKRALSLYRLDWPCGLPFLERVLVDA